MLHKKKKRREAGEGRGEEEEGGGGVGSGLCNHSKRNQTTKPVTERSPQQPSVSREGQRPRQAKRVVVQIKNKHLSLSLSRSILSHISESN